MKQKQEYQFAVLRFIPDVVAGEFVNIGVAFMGMNFFRFTWEDESRFNRIFPEKWCVSRPEFIEYCRRLAFGFTQAEKTFEPHMRLCDTLEAVLPPDDSSYQFGSIMFGLTDDFSKEFDSTVKRFLK